MDQQRGIITRIQKNGARVPGSFDFTKNLCKNYKVATALLYCHMGQILAGCIILYVKLNIYLSTYLQYSQVQLFGKLGKSLISLNVVPANKSVLKVFIYTML